MQVAGKALACQIRCTSVMTGIERKNCMQDSSHAVILEDVVKIQWPLLITAEDALRHYSSHGQQTAPKEDSSFRSSKLISDFCMQAGSHPAHPGKRGQDAAAAADHC